MKDYLFAYGTLGADRPPQEIAATIKHFNSVGPGFIFARLYDMGEYPGAVLDGSERAKVFGKIWELPANAALLERLDAYEEFDPEDPGTSLFVRKRATIYRENRRPLRGWVYEYNRAVKSAPVITTGRYSKVSA